MIALLSFVLLMTGMIGWCVFQSLELFVFLYEGHVVSFHWFYLFIPTKKVNHREKKKKNKLYSFVKNMATLFWMDS